MLSQRGVDDPQGVVDKVIDEDLDGVLGAIALWDDMQKTYRPPGPGLLVAKIRQGGVAGYRRPHERTNPEDLGGRSEAGSTLFTSIRGQILGAAMTRADARDHFRKTADRLMTNVDALIDSAMTSGWEETPPHPANPFGWRAPWEYPDAYGFTRYQLWSGGYRRWPRIPRDLTVRRAPNESQWAFACRFWGWDDPEGFTESADAARAAIEAFEDERQAKLEQERQQLIKAREQAQLARTAPADAEPVQAQTALLEEHPASAITGGHTTFTAAAGVADPGPDPSKPMPEEASQPDDDEW
jgi:hypothetical protein